MATLKNNYLVQKRNVLNEMIGIGNSLTELRFFSIYLSKIHKDKPQETRVVRFPLKDFRAIMGLNRLNIKHIQSVTDGLLRKIVHVPNEHGGYTGFQLFKECTVSKSENGESYVEIDAHDKALPLMFEYKNRFFSYQVGNVLRLTSVNQHRMYELLKQYEKIGERIISIESLKLNLGISTEDYTVYSDFKKRVLDTCQQALEQNTDIKFTYEPYGKKGPGGKILILKFTIMPNGQNANQITLDSFIEQQRDDEENASADNEQGDVNDDLISFLSEACGNEFSRKEMTVLYHTMVDKSGIDAGRGLASYTLDSYNYLQRKYAEMNMRAEKTHINSRFAYLRSIIGVD